jgi:hypothetical protein
MFFWFMCCISLVSELIFSKSAIIRQINSDTKHVLEYLFVVFNEKVNSIIKNSLANIS